MGLNEQKLNKIYFNATEFNKIEPCCYHEVYDMMLYDDDRKLFPW